jgi:acetylornithine deacetylase/succinyl-diaminopimelate desuccinylase-like protein
VVVVSDTRMLGPGRPAITVGLRGLLNLELEVRGPCGDLHAGTFGGAVHNPLQALCEMIAGLHGRDGRVAVPGFYDRVRRVSERDRLALAAVAPVDAAILRQARVASGWGERGWTLHERTTLRPALTVNGIGGGYQGPGSKSVIPATASAKLGVRLVPDQCPAEVERLLRRYLARAAPATVQATVRTGSRIPPVLFGTAHPVMEAASGACWRGFGAHPAFLRSGGTIPAVGMLHRSLGAPVVLLGLALPDDRAHAPNERLHLPNLWQGIDTLIWFLLEAAHLRPQASPDRRRTEDAVR